MFNNNRGPDSLCVYPAQSLSNVDVKSSAVRTTAYQQIIDKKINYAILRNEVDFLDSTVTGLTTYMVSVSNQAGQVIGAIAIQLEQDKAYQQIIPRVLIEEPYPACFVGLYDPDGVEIWNGKKNIRTEE